MKSQTSDKIQQLGVLIYKSKREEGFCITIDESYQQSKGRTIDVLQNYRI